MANSTKPVPAFLYGTAWKEDETRRLVRLALEAGFRGIDTANQRKHYHEVAVGQGIAGRRRGRRRGAGTRCSSRRSSRTAPGRTSGCRTTRRPPWPRRCASPA